MQHKITKDGRPKIVFHARFNGDAGGEVVREFRAVNESQAHKIAKGIANKQKWLVLNVGRV